MKPPGEPPTFPGTPFLPNSNLIEAQHAAPPTQSPDTTRLCAVVLCIDLIVSPNLDGTAPGHPVETCLADVIERLTAVTNQDDLSALLPACTDSPHA